MRQVMEECADGPVDVGFLAAALAELACQLAAAIQALGLVRVAVPLTRMRFCGPSYETCGCRATDRIRFPHAPILVSLAGSC
jgi:hypothetical protein